MPPPAIPKVYHIVHCGPAAIDRLGWMSLVRCEDGRTRQQVGTSIGMTFHQTAPPEQRQLSSHPGLSVGDCVPFYFLPALRYALFVIYKRNLSLT